MTHDELIAISTQELEKLPADELEIIVRHFQTEDRAELARQLADEAEEMWSGDHEAPVPEDEWPSAHLQMILGMHRDEEREARDPEGRPLRSGGGAARCPKISAEPTAHASFSHISSEFGSSRRTSCRRRPPWDR